MEAQRREAAARETPCQEVRLGVGAVDGAAAPPQAARRFGRIVCVGLARRRRSRQGEEGARLVERRAQRRRVRAVTDDVEQVAVLARRGVGEFPRRAGAGEADVEGAAAGAVQVARDPVAALPASVGEIAAANGLGARAEGGGDGGRVHGAAPAGMGDMDTAGFSWLGGDTPIPAGPGLPAAPRSKRPARSAGARSGRGRARSRQQKEWGRRGSADPELQGGC